MEFQNPKDLKPQINIINLESIVKINFRAEIL